LNPEAVLTEWRERFGARPVIHEARACDFCRKTGYRGRIGMFELLTVTPEMRTMMLRKATAHELRALSMRNGMRTLKQDGIEKVLAGDTDIHEVRAAAY
jgi:type II secretory ATPase GspE/PulE/Tfp pilus assembly ATPase PilB-like protein